MGEVALSSSPMSAAVGAPCVHEGRADEAERPADLALRRRLGTRGGETFSASAASVTRAGVAQMY